MTVIYDEKCVKKEQKKKLNSEKGGSYFFLSIVIQLKLI